MLNILISNDDGFEAKGLEILVRVAANFGNVYVSAPMTEQSGRSQAIDVKRVLTIVEAIPLKGAIKMIINDAPPAQTIDNGISYYSDIDFDLVLAGINHGLNIATNVSYSGTIGIVKEARIMSIPAIAFSAANIDAVFIEDEVYKVLDEILKSKTHLMESPLNVNIPKEKPLGVKFTKMGRKRFHTEIEKRSEKDKYDKILSKKLFIEDEDSDVVAIKNNFISITPILIDQTDHEVLAKLKKMR